MNRFLSTQPIFEAGGLAILRIIVGLLMAYHGLEVFESTKIEEYAKWDSIKILPAPLFMAYLGKGLELVTGCCFVLGLFTRPASLLMAVNMLFICFKVATGKFWNDDQHPFLFALVALVFFFTGPGNLSLDKVFFNRK
jgi:putative oxidoreductase